MGGLLERPRERAVEEIDECWGCFKLRFLCYYFAPFCSAENAIMVVVPFGVGVRSLGHFLVLLQKGSAGHSARSALFLGDCYASVVELVYTSDLKSDGLTAMRVQVPPLAPIIFYT